MIFSLNQLYRAIQIFIMMILPMVLPKIGLEKNSFSSSVFLGKQSMKELSQTYHPQITTKHKQVETILFKRKVQYYHRLFDIFEQAFLGSFCFVVALLFNEPRPLFAVLAATPRIQVIRTEQRNHQANLCFYGYDFNWSLSSSC